MPSGARFIKRVDALGGAVLAGGVVVPDGHCWVMGDGENSADSRSWGPVPLADVIGVVIARLHAET